MISFFSRHWIRGKVPGGRAWRKRCLARDREGVPSVRVEGACQRSVTCVWVPGWVCRGEEGSFRVWNGPLIFFKDWWYPVRRRVSRRGHCGVVLPFVLAILWNKAFNCWVKFKTNGSLILPIIKPKIKASIPRHYFFRSRPVFQFSLLSLPLWGVALLLGQLPQIHRSQLCFLLPFFSHHFK